MFRDKWNAKLAWQCVFRKIWLLFTADAPLMTCNTMNLEAGIVLLYVLDECRFCLVHHGMSHPCLVASWRTHVFILAHHQKLWVILDTSLGFLSLSLTAIWALMLQKVNSQSFVGGIVWTFFWYKNCSAVALACLLSRSFTNLRFLINGCDRLIRHHMPITIVDNVWHLVEAS